jgi:uncharacterized protein (DUF983 family)
MGDLKMPEQSEMGCGTAIFALIMLVVAYLVGLATMDGMTEGPRLWWHYLVAFPIGVICVNIVFGILKAMAS